MYTKYCDGFMKHYEHNFVTALIFFALPKNLIVAMSREQRDLHLWVRKNVNLTYTIMEEILFIAKGSNKVLQKHNTFS